jgi:hypothetical protein
MAAYLRDVAALAAVVSFVASIGVWAEALRMLAA